MNNPLQVLIVGGYGEFGGRLAQLLMRDGHDITVAGRHIEKAQQFCKENGGNALKLDRATDLDRIDGLDVDVVVDAAGPFQSYGDNDSRYALARKALECGAHYVDLSDDGDFSYGIHCLDELAKQHNRFALSGASSTPALSGAVVTALLPELSSIEKIETSILPGSRAPQGQSAILAVLEQVGNPVSFWRDGVWVNHSGWSAPIRKQIGNRINRKANLINAADAVLFPEYFQAKSVLFRAGLAIHVMHLSLQWLGFFRSVGWLPNLTRFATLLRALADRLTPFGSDYGGMLVEVIGEKRKTESLAGSAGNHTDNDHALADEQILSDASLASHTWHLAAQPGQGPFVPTIPTRALLRNIDQIPCGARACIGVLSLDEYVAAMDDLGISTGSDTQPFNFLFSDLLTNQWANMPESLRNTHRIIDKKTLNGYAKITRGTSWMTQLIATVFRFPSAAERIAVQVTKTRSGESETWVRDFAGQRFKSTLRCGVAPRRQPNEPSLNEAWLQEQFGLLKFLIKLKLDDDGLHFPVVSGTCLGVRIPNAILPVSNTREFEKNGTMHFCVELLGPFKSGLIVRYEGWLK